MKNIKAPPPPNTHTHWQTLTLWKACPQFTVNFSQHLDVLFSRHFHQTLHRCGEKGEKGRLGLMEWIFFSCFPRRWLWLTEPRSYFMCLTPNCISGPGLSVSQQDKAILPCPILLALFCTVTEYNGHHWILWILLALSSGFCQCARQLCGSRSTLCFCCGLIFELSLGE